MRAEIRVATWAYKDANGKRRRAYFGEVVELTDDEYERAERAGVFAATPEADTEEETPLGIPLPPELVTEETVTTEPPVTPEAPTAMERPKMAAVKEQWVDYAVSRGMSREQAEDMTRADLIAQFGGA